MGCAASRQLNDLLFPDYLKQAGVEAVVQGVGADGKKRQSYMDVLGGKAGLENAVNNFQERLLGDPRTNAQFKKATSADMLQSKQACLFMHACGSPDVNKGTVYESCKDLNLKNEQFAAVQEHFTATLQAMKLPASVISEAEHALTGAKKQALGLEDGAGKQVVNPNSVFSRIGGEEAVESCVEILYGKVMNDPSISPMFKGINMAAHRPKMASFLSHAFGGPTPYTGADLYAAHQNLKISEAQFNGFAGHIVATLRVLRVPKDVISDVLDIIETAKPKVLGQEDAEGHSISTLYDRIGGADAVEAIVELFYPKVLADPTISHYFESMDMTSQMRKLVSFMTFVLGGAGQYTGRSMAEAHQHLGIKTSQFDNLAAHFAATLKLLRVPKDAADEAFAIVLGAKSQVVTVDE